MVIRQLPHSVTDRLSFAPDVRFAVAREEVYRMQLKETTSCAECALITSSTLSQSEESFQDRDWLRLAYNT